MGFQQGRLEDLTNKAGGRSSTTMGLKDAQTISQSIGACPRDIDGSDEPTSKRTKIIVKPSSFFLFFLFFLAIMQQPRRAIAKASTPSDELARLEGSRL